MSRASKKIASLTPLAAAVAYAILVFHPTIGEYLVRSLAAIAVLVVGWLGHQYLEIKLSEPEEDIRRKERILKAPIG